MVLNSLVGLFSFRSIIATLANIMVRLTEGRSVSDKVEKKTWNYYSFVDRYRGTHNVKIVVSETSGNSAVYITLDGTEPTEQNYVYSTGSMGDGQDVVELNNDDPAYAPCLISDCTIIIAVYGYTDAEFNMLVASSMTSTQLNFGVPQLGSIRYALYDQYRFSAAGMTDASDGVRVSIDQYSGTVRAFIACDMEFPDATKYNLLFNPSENGKIDLTLSSFTECTETSMISVAVEGITSATYR